MQTSSLTRFFLATAAVVIILAGVKLAGEIVIQFLLSLFIAIICSPVIRFMTNRKIPLGLAVAFLFVLFIIAFFFLASMINNTIREFTTSIPLYKETLAMKLNTLEGFIQKWNIPISLPEMSILDNFDPSIVMRLVSRLLLSFSDVVSNIFMLLLVVVFMLFESPTIKHKLAIAFSHNNPKKIKQEEDHINRVVESIIRYLGVKTVVSALTGFCIWLLLESFSVQYAVLWAVLAFLLNYIPNIGSILAGIPIVLQALILNDFPIAAGVTIGVVVINMIVGNILEPKMMGKTLGLSTLVVTLSLLFWGWLLGTVGMLLSVPLTMALKIALESSPRTIQYAVLLGDVPELENTEKTK